VLARSDLTRRELVLGGIAFGAAAVGSAGPLAPPAAASGSTSSSSQATPPPSDAVIIGGLASVELLTEYVYKRAVRSGRLSRRLHGVAQQIAGHESKHAQALAAQLPALGGSPPGGPDNDGDAEVALSEHHVEIEFDELRTDRDWLRLMLGVEDVLERNYHQGLFQLRRDRLLRLCAEIYASEAQHSAVLGVLRHPGDIKKAVPGAFVNGN
jgi:hypothetical protein